MTIRRSLREGMKERRGGEGGHWGQRIQDNSQEEIKDNSQEERQNHSQEEIKGNSREERLNQLLSTRWHCWSPWPTCPSLTTAWPPSSAGLLTTLSWALCLSHILLKMGREADIVGEANVACSSFRLFLSFQRMGSLVRGVMLEIKRRLPVQPNFNQHIPSRISQRSVNYQMSSIMICVFREWRVWAKMLCCNNAFQFNNCSTTIDNNQ